MNYDFVTIENKWRKYWEENNINEYDDKKPTYYCLDMFPYPSGSGLHVGHWRGYVLSDVVSRYKLLQGYQVLHPMGWDAFGLPAENYAIKLGIHPKQTTEQSISNVKRQLKEISTIYDWDREVNTTDPEFYKWTQWIFLKMYEKGLAYEKEMPLNWCDNCKCVLSNEESTGGACDRCGSTVTKKNLRQWMLKITEYGDRLLTDLDKLDWTDKVKKMQSDWIGKSYGAEIDFKIQGMEQSLTVYTTRPDTLYGATFMVMSPEHKEAKSIATEDRLANVEDYIFKASTKSNVDRMSGKDKTGVFTGRYGINPINNKLVPIWISDYVLADYGTGVIMCVPAHDERDFEFAKKFDIEIIPVIKGEGIETPLENAYTGTGVMINSGEFDGIDSEKAKDIVGEYIEKEKIGKRTVNFKLRDWVFSRQRYWGEPIPLIHCDCCGTVPVPEKDLPVVLPNVEKYLPTSTGESPLADIDEWVNCTCPTCGKSAKRETNTMPQWAGSSWYFLRYLDNNNSESLVGEEALKKWGRVDLYVGGIEHAVLHLLYARFYTKFLYDIGVVDFDEPFKQLFNQGMICRNGDKMSKSKGNVVSPDELVEKFGCDSLRMYELFVAPPELDAEWDDRGIEGVYRYLNKLWKLIVDNKDNFVDNNEKLVQPRHKLIYEITNRLNSLSMNTVVSGFMEYTNKIVEISRESGLDKETAETLLVLIAPFAPHIAEELWQVIGNQNTIFVQSWPEYDKAKLVADTLKLPIQVNGKMRGTIEVPNGSEKDVVLTMAKEFLGDRLDGNVVKEIYVPNKIVNFVVK